MWVQMNEPWVTQAPLRDAGELGLEQKGIRLTVFEHRLVVLFLDLEMRVH